MYASRFAGLALEVAVKGEDGRRRAAIRGVKDTDDWGRAIACLDFVCSDALRCKRGRPEPLRELGFPFKALDCLCVIHPLPLPLVALQPVLVKANNIELVEVIRGGRRWYCGYITCDGATYARCLRRRRARDKEGRRIRR